MLVPAAVVDTNVLVSALLRPAGPPGAVTRAIVQGRLMPVVCTDILDEYAEVLSRPHFPFDKQDASELVTLIGQQALWIEITSYPDQLALPDPSDWPFVAAALAPDCPVITGNARHFPKRTGVRVVSAREWVSGCET
jgi:putative PIN family toxin of toxin-antitoxin system